MPVTITQALTTRCTGSANSGGPRGEGRSGRLRPHISGGRSDYRAGASARSRSHPPSSPPARTSGRISRSEGENREENCAKSFSGRWEVCPAGARQLWGSFPELSLLYFFDAPNLCSQHIRVYLPLICLRVYIYSTIPIFIFFPFLIYIFSYIHNCLTRRNASEMPHLSYRHCLNSPFISPVERRWEEQMEESGEGKDPSRFPFLLSKIIVMPPLHKRKCHKKFRSSCQRFRPHTQRGD